MNVRRRGVGLGEGVHRHAEVDRAAGQRLGGPEIGRGRGIGLDGESRWRRSRSARPARSCRRSARPWRRTRASRRASGRHSRAHRGPCRSARHRSAQCRSGAAISSAETYWLERPPSISTRPAPKLPLPSTITGGQPVGALAAMPSWRSAVTSGPIGRLRMCSSPSTITMPSQSATAAVRKRVAVPALPRNSGSAGAASAAGAADDEAGVVRLLDDDAHLPQRGRHQRRVLALERAGEPARARRQRGQQQRAVGDRLRARRRDAADQRAVRRNDGQSLRL